MTIKTTLIAAAALAAVSVASAGGAEAKPNKPAGVNDYNKCIVAGLPDIATASQERIKQVHSNCCTDLGGIFNEMNGLCYLPNGDTARGSGSPRPGSVVVLPPGGTSARNVQ